MPRKLSYLFQRGGGLNIRQLKSGHFLKPIIEPIRRTFGGVVRALYEEIPPPSDRKLISHKSHSKKKKPLKFKF
jgi:hypothetical protein